MGSYREGGTSRGDRPPPPHSVVLLSPLAWIRLSCTSAAKPAWRSEASVELRESAPVPVRCACRVASVVLCSTRPADTLLPRILLPPLPLANGDRLPPRPVPNAHFSRFSQASSMGGSSASLSHVGRSESGMSMLVGDGESTNGVSLPTKQLFRLVRLYPCRAASVRGQRAGICWLEGSREDGLSSALNRQQTGRRDRARRGRGQGDRPFDPLAHPAKDRSRPVCAGSEYKSLPPSHQTQFTASRTVCRSWDSSEAASLDLNVFAVPRPSWSALD